MTTLIRQRNVTGPTNYGVIFFHRFLNILLIVLNLFLVIRLILKATGANPNTGFVHFIYTLTKPLIYPFIGIFPNTPAEVNYGIFEWATFVAIIVYTLAFIVIRLIFDSFVTPKNKTTVKANLNS